MIGIYQIFIGDHYYFGSSKNINERIKMHTRKLKGKYHPNKFMQAQYNIVNDLTYDIVYECCEEELLKVEQLFIDTHYGLSECMNLADKVERPPAMKGIPKGPQTEEHKRNAGIAKGLPVLINGVEYYSQSEAARQLGISQATIQRWLTGKRKCSYGWEVRYK